MYVAVFDVGTSVMKGVLVDRQAYLTYMRSVGVETQYGPDGQMEQNPLDWWEGVKIITEQWWDIGITPDEIAMVTFSGQMEDVIPITYSAQSPLPAILYSDMRADKEANWIQRNVPDVQKITGNTVKASTPSAKLKWLKKRRPDEYEDTATFVFSAKDFVIYQLTNAVVTDPTTGATTGMMSMNAREWEKDILLSIGLDAAKLPVLLDSSDVAGNVTNDAAHATGFRTGTPVLCGCGDAGASTMGAGAVEKGDSYAYIGTTGWAAVVQGNLNTDVPDEKLFQLAHLPEDTTIAIVPLLNAGNVHNWAAHTFVSDDTVDKYTAFENLVEKSPVGSNGVLFLPYLHGERFPVQDPNTKGAFWGIGPNVSKSDLARSVMEGISFSLKQLMNVLVGERSGAITLIGGGTNSPSWCSILADCLGRPVRVPEESTFMPAIGAAASAFVRLGWTSDYSEFVQHVLKGKKEKLYEPDAEHYKQYEAIYQQFLRMYSAMKEI